MKKNDKWHEFLLINSDVIRLSIVTISVFIAMSLLSNRFLRINNFLSMGYQLPELGIYSIAMMLVMITGGRDLSIVGIGNLSGIIAAKILSKGFSAGLCGTEMAVNIIWGVLAALLVGALCGIFNGMIIAFAKIPSMMVTLATSYIFTGIGVVITDGEAVSKVYPEYVYLGNNTLLSVPIPLWILIVALVVLWILLNKTKYGFDLKMVGSNPIASEYSGIDVKKIIVKTFLISGILCSVCGLEILARTDSAKADYAFTYTFQAILCVVLGATNPDGGFGKVSCLIFALLSMQFLSSGFSLLHLGGYFKEFAWGLLLLIVLISNYFSNEIKRKRSIKKISQTSTQHPLK